MRTALANNPKNMAVQRQALEYLNKLHPSALSTLPNATTGPYTRQNAEANTAIVSNSITNPSQPNDYSLGKTSSTNSGVDRLQDTMADYEANSKKTAAETESNARKF